VLTAFLSLAIANIISPFSIARVALEHKQWAIAVLTTSSNNDDSEAPYLPTMNDNGPIEVHPKRITPEHDASSKACHALAVASFVKLPWMPICVPLE